MITIKFPAIASLDKFILDQIRSLPNLSHADNAITTQT